MSEPSGGGRLDLSGPSESPDVASGAAGPCPSGDWATVAVRDALTEAELVAVLEATFPAGTESYHWCEREDALSPLAAGVPTDCGRWRAGRVWGCAAEVRWRETGDGRFGALYLGDGDGAPPGFTPLDGTWRAVAGEEAGGLYLWGERLATGAFYDGRLGRTLDYPAGLVAGSHARVPFRLLVDAANRVRFVRLTLGE